MRLFLAIPALAACAHPAPALAVARPAEIGEAELVIATLAEHRAGTLAETLDPATGYVVIDADEAGHREVPIAAEHLCGKGASAYLDVVERIAFTALDGGEDGSGACVESDRFVECSFHEPGHNGARYTLDFVAEPVHGRPQLARIRVDETMGPHWDDARAVADQSAPRPCP